MLRVPISHAQAGMVLAMPVFHPKANSTILLKPGVTLERSTIDRMHELRLPEVWIKYPQMAQIRRFVSTRVMAARAAVASDVAQAFDDAGRNVHAKLHFNQYKSSMGKLMTRLIDDPSSALFVGELVDSGQPAVRHGANVGYISMLMGIRLGFYLMRERGRLPAHLAKDVTNLGVAAMLHDIGMTRLPKSVRERWSREHDQSDPEWQRHTRIGFEMIRGHLDPSAAAAVLHHHQRYDGSGFPKRKNGQGKVVSRKGSDIHIFARIIAAADLYDRLVHPASTLGDSEEGTPSRPPVRALNMLLGPGYRNLIDPVVLRALIAVCPPYAPGTIVRLSNGVKGVVVDWSSSDPCRPIVDELTHFEDEERGERYDLRADTSITIVYADGHDVSKDNFYPGSNDEFSLRQISRNMENRAHTLIKKDPAA